MRDIETSRRPLVCTLFLPQLLLVAAALPATAQCSQLKSKSLARSESIGLLYDAHLDPAIVERAIDFWRRCRNYGSGFPPFLNGGEGATRTITVRRFRGTSGNRHCGLFRGHTITLFDFYREKDYLWAPCGSLEQNLAHELGHVLGLEHAGDLECDHYIMAQLSSDSISRSVSAEECQAAGQRWISAHEQELLVSAGIDF